MAQNPDMTDDAARPDAATQSALGDFAEDLGRMLGTAQHRATAWLDQRTAILTHLTKVRDTAQQLITQLTGATAGPAPARRGRPPATRRGRGRPRQQEGSEPRARKTRKTKRTRKPMSEEARAKIAEAQRRRWAKQKEEGS